MEDLEKSLEAKALETQQASAASSYFEAYEKQGFLGKFLMSPANLLWVDPDTKKKLILFAVACLFGPVLTILLLQNPQWPPPAKLILSTGVYISTLFIVFNIYDQLVNFVLRWLFGLELQLSLVLEFFKFILTFSTTAVYQYTFIYIPVLHYQPPRNFTIMFSLTLLYSMVAGTIFYRFRQMKDIALKSKVAQAEAQYSILESQMQPHFLFNSLNVLSELIYVDPDQANAMTQKLADLYREILNNSKTKFSTLESEISILTKYIEIQKIRFGDRIRFTSHVSPAFYNLQIPSLMLQTLVENAIKHGISPKKDGGEIDLTVEKQGNRFEVCISNTGSLYKGHKESKRSTGLQNTKNRLALTYGSKSSFKIYSDENRTYVKFSITGRTS
jgi:two-component system LytT family sensor kinase